MVLAAAMLPEAQREQFVQTMEAAREGLRARMQQEWTQETRDKAEQVHTHTLSLLSLSLSLIHTHRT